MKDIIEPLAFIAKREAVQCKGCHGRGEKGAGTFATEYARDMGYPPKPCPDCAELRKIAEMEQANTCKYIYECECGATKERPCSEYNPTPTITQIAGMMKTCGVWRKFVYWLWDELTVEIGGKAYANFKPEGLATVLTSDEFYPVVAEFLRKEVAG